MGADAAVVVDKPQCARVLNGKTHHLSPQKVKVMNLKALFKFHNKLVLILKPLLRRNVVITWYITWSPFFKRRSRSFSMYICLAEILLYKTSYFEVSCWKPCLLSNVRQASNFLGHIFSALSCGGCVLSVWESTSRYSDTKFRRKMISYARGSQTQRKMYGSYHLCFIETQKKISFEVFTTFASFISCC